MAVRSSAVESIELILKTAPPPPLRSACVVVFLIIAAGVGWGLIHAVILVGTALSKHTGPGAAFSSSCPHVPSVIVSGESRHRLLKCCMCVAELVCALFVRRDLCSPFARRRC